MQSTIRGWECSFLVRRGDGCFAHWRNRLATGVVGALKQVSPALLTAGALGACLVFAMAWMLPHFGARGVFIILIAGQVLGEMVLSQYGWPTLPFKRLRQLI
jgi:bacterial/archaeal transporter family-2 protein